RGRWKDDVSKLGGLRKEDVLNHEVLEAAEQPDCSRLVRLRSRGILAHDVDRAHLAVIHRLEHLAEVVSAFRRDRGIPSALEGRTHRGVLEILETWKPVRDRAHVAAALHVLLP